MAECLYRTGPILLSRPLRQVRLRGELEAEARREQELEEAFQRGYDAATTAIEAKVASERQQLAQLQDQTLRRIAEKEETLVEDLRAALPDLVMEGVRRVLPEIEFDRSIVENIVRGILEERTSDREELIMFLSPGDYELMEGLRGELSLSHPTIELKPDESLQSGDCLVRSRFGIIDARIETKIKNLREALV